MYYHAPLYRLVAADPRIDFTAIFASTAGVRPYDRGFGREVVWDDTVLDGYRSAFLKRAERRSPGGFLSLRDPDVVSIVTRGRFDALWLHGYNSVTHVLAAAAQRAVGGAVLYREEQTLIRPRAAWRRALKAPLLRLLFSGVHGLYIGSESRRWFERYGIPPERLFFTPYAADNDALRLRAAELQPHRAELRRALGVDDERPVILCVGRLIPEKQPFSTIEAFAEVRSRVPCALVFVGSGPLEREVAEAVRRMGVPDVILAGFREHALVAEAYAAADVFLLNSISETWGMCLNEALNFALPVVASERVGAAPDLVLDGVNGARVPHDDVAALAAALTRLVEDDELRVRYGHESLRIVARYTNDAAAAGVISATRAAVGELRWRSAGPLAQVEVSQ